MIGKDEFTVWKSDVVTKAVMEALVAKREMLKEVLANSAGIDPEKDSVHRGYCTAIQDILDVNLQDLESE